MKALIDTCIIIDALQSRRPFCVDAEKIFLATASFQCESYITAKEVTDIYYLTHHATHSIETTKDIISKLLSLFNMIDTTAGDITQALVSSMTDYEDAVMTESAIRMSMDCIVTRNLDDYKNAPCPVYSPDEFLKKIDYQDPL